MIRTTNFRRVSCLCLALIMCFFCFARPVTAHASGLGAAATGVVVAAEAPLVLGALIIALGIYIATDAGVFDGIIEKCQEALTASGHVEEGKINVISYQGKSYIPSDTVEAVRSYLFDEEVVTYSHPDMGFALRAGDVINGGSNTWGSYKYTVSSFCNAFCYNMGDTTYYSLFFVSDSPFSVSDNKKTYESHAFENRYYIHLVVLSSYWSNAGYPKFSYTYGAQGEEACIRHAIGNFQRDLTTTKEVALGDIAPPDVKIETGYETWVQFGIVFEDTGGSNPPPDDEDPITILGLPYTAPKLKSDLQNMTQEDAQQPGDIVVEEPEPEPTIDTGGNTSGGGGISQTWLGENLAALGEWLSGIKTAIIELPAKFAEWFRQLIENLASMGQTIADIGSFLVGTTTVQSPLEAIQFDALFNLFPFNIPYGIYQAINFWSAAPAAPTITIPLPDYDGELGVYEYKINLADIPGMDTLAAILRAGELILFVVGLVMITRKVTKW